MGAASLLVWNAYSSGIHSRVGRGFPEAALCLVVGTRGYPLCLAEDGTSGPHGARPELFPAPRDCRQKCVYLVGLFFWGGGGNSCTEM